MGQRGAFALVFWMVAAAGAAAQGARIFHHPVPEIDATAAVAALALLASVGLIVYNRLKR